jgi:hypothetical protein
MEMPRIDEKVMFEIFREEGYDRRYRVVYFTELGEHDKEREINRALSGSHVFDGYLDASRLDGARTAVAEILKRLNDGESPERLGIDSTLAAFLVR